jgi:hypothetical protein
MFEYLERFGFSHAQLKLMEAAFEGFSGHEAASNFHYANGGNDRVAGRTAQSARKVLRAIMKNVIKNKGVFKP